MVSLETMNFEPCGKGSEMHGWRREILEQIEVTTVMQAKSLRGEVMVREARVLTLLQILLMHPESVTMQAAYTQAMHMRKIIKKRSHGTSKNQETRDRKLLRYKDRHQSVTLH